MEGSLLEINNLHTSFFTENGEVPSVNGVSFSVKKGEIIGVVGESGCGKSVTSLSILQLINPPGKIKDGEILFHGKDLTKMSEKEIRKVRGNQISMIFQEPLTSLNPVFTIGYQISETIRLHQKLDKKEAKQKSISLLDKVGIPNASKQYHSFPHQLSGGMRQRVMIAMALSCNPELLIADEPTTALDVTIQKQILRLMRNLKDELNTSIILITHDLGVIAEMVDRVVVMYGGEVVEENDVNSIFRNPKHPYTKGLLDSTPKINQLDEKLISIKGNVPTPDQLPYGCNFQDRCPFAMEKCRQSPPELIEVDNQSSVKCWLHHEEVKTYG